MISWEVKWHWLYKPLNVISGCSVVAIVALTTADVILRYLGRPIEGVYEIVGLMGAVIYTAALPDTTARQGHVGVQIIVQRLPSKARTFVHAITISVSIVLFGLISWQSIEVGKELGESGEILSSIQFSFHYLLYLIALASVAVCVTLIKQLANIFRNGTEQKKG
jgi:TRAP-type C4-dicarboxylate transport system permease small subunit